MAGKGEGGPRPWGTLQAQSHLPSSHPPISFEKMVTSFIRFLFFNEQSFLFTGHMYIYLKPANGIVLYTGYLLSWLRTRARSHSA